MRVGIHAGYSSGEQLAQQCREADVDEVFLSADSVPGFQEGGHLAVDDLTKVQEELAALGIGIAGIILGRPSAEAVLGKVPDETTRFCETIRAAGSAGVESTLFYPMDSLLHFHEFHEGRPLMVMPGDEEWPAVIDFYRAVVGAADAVGLPLGCHLWAVEVVHEIWEAVPSPNNGVTYCQGMQLFDEDPHTPSETWGMDKIHFAHARNQVRHGPALMDHKEAPLESGDVDMARCVRALLDAGYEGVIVPEHLGPQSTADAVAYLKSLIPAA